MIPNKKLKLTNMQELFLLLHIDKLNNPSNLCIDCVIGPMPCIHKINLIKATEMNRNTSCVEALKFLGEYLKAKYHLK